MRRAAAPFAIGVWMMALLGGCAAPGDPIARHPVVPTPVTDLSVRQSGTDAALTFSLPTRSTDRVTLTELPTVEIYRATLASGAKPDRKTPWRLLYTVPAERIENYLKDGHIEFLDPLTADDLAHPSGNLLAYMVRTRAMKARASEDSNFFTVGIYPAPEPPGNVRATVTESAIVLNWAKPSLPADAASGGYLVYRTEIEPSSESAAQDVSQSKLKSPVELLGPSPTTDFRDSHFDFGKTYSYTVRSVAKFGAELVESADSAPSIITARDTFPPATPSGLEVATIPATPQLPAYVELSWSIGSEADLAGYYVYRSEHEDETGERVTKELLPSPTFRDISVVPGGKYFYRVSAVDRSGNESPKSAPASTVIP